MTGSDSRRRKAQAILGEQSDGTMQFKTITSPQQQEGDIQAAAAETKSVPVGINQDEDSAATITTFWNLQQEVEKLKEANNIQVRDGQGDEAQADSAEEGEYHEIYYGRETGSNLGIYILPSDEDHSSSVTVEELRIEEEVPNTPYHIFHKKDSEENTATGNYGNYNGGNSAPPASGGGGGSSSSTSGSSSSGIDNIFGDNYSPEESQLRDVLNHVKELGANVNIAIHQKTSAEKDGFNDPFRAPSNFEFYNPGAGGGTNVGPPNGGEGIAPPRGNDGPTSMPTVFGKRNCKATNGVFGDNRQERSGGGVTLKFQYELNTDATPGGPFQRASLYNEILPALEDTMVTTMLPAFFSDECMRIPSGSFSRKKKVRGRHLRGGGFVEDENNQIELVNEFDPEVELTLGYQHQHRRLNRVIGIDSDPMDFPLPNEDCSDRYIPPNPTILPKCYVMEGAMTVYFPENFNFRDLVLGAQLTLLNAIKEGMEMGTISEMAHPAILGLTFMESSYSLRPLLPGGLPVAPVEKTPPPPEKGGNGNVGLIVGIIIVLIAFVIFAGCFFRYRLRQEQAKLEAMMRDSAKKKKKKKKKKSDNDSDQSSDGTPADPTSLYILNRYSADMRNSEDEDDADDEDNLTDREKEIHQRLKKRRKTKKKMRRASYASNLSSNHDGSFSTLNDSDQNLMEYYANMTVSSTQGSKTTTSSDSTTDVSGSESSTTSHSQTFHTKSTSTSDHTTTSDRTTTSDSGTTSSAGTTSDSDDDSEEEDTFDMNDMNFNLGGAGGNFSNGAMRTQPRKKKGQRSNLIMTGDDDMSVGTETTGATEAVSNLSSRNRGGAFGGGFGGGGGASVATEVMGNTGRGGGGLYGEYSGGFSGGASAAPSVDFSAATEAMGNLGRGRNVGGGGYAGGGFSGGASAAPSVDFSAATEAMGNLGRGRNVGGGGFAGGGFSGGASAAPSVDFSAATEAMGNLRGRGPVRMGMAGGASAAPSVDFSAATEAMSNRRRATPSSGGSAGPGASVAMSAATEAIKNTGRAKKPQQMESIGELTFSDF